MNKAAQKRVARILCEFMGDEWRLSKRLYMSAASKVLNACCDKCPDEMRTALLQQRGWVLHWLDDIAANLKPTEDSLRAALASIDAATS